MLDFEDWAVIGYNDDTGIGNQLEAIKKDIGISRHLVVPSKKLLTKPLTHDEVLINKDFTSDQLACSLCGVRVLLFIETCGWHEKLIDIASKLGIVTICLVNWEWFKTSDPNWKRIDYLASATRCTLRFLRHRGFTNLLHLPPPLKIENLPNRKITGKGKIFFIMPALLMMMTVKVLLQ